MRVLEYAMRRAKRIQFMGLTLGVCCLQLLVLSGCGSDPYPLAPVSGTVTLDGAPLAGANLGFEPIKSGSSVNAGPASYATTDAEGRFRLETPDGRAGAVVGEHRVWIRTLKAERGRDGEAVLVAQERLPPRYNSQTGLTYNVPDEGSDVVEFALTSD